VARKAFYSFHYKPDNWRASQIRNMGATEGNRPCSDNDWETIVGGGDEKIKKWIADQMSGRSCVIVLIGAATADRKWINHEIITGWNAKKGVVGVYIHNLLDSDKKQAAKGANPFASIGYGDAGRKLSSIAKAYDPPYTSSKNVYDHISENLENWVAEAITIRNDN
jgi:hypothetical protein